MEEKTGWILDLYAHPGKGMVLWMIEEDGSRRSYQHAFPVTFYIAGENKQLRKVWRYLRKQPIPVKLERTERKELFNQDPTPVLAVQVPDAANQPRLFYTMNKLFPQLQYFDADISLPLRYAARYNIFPMAKCRYTADEDRNLLSMKVLDSPWEIEPELPELRVMSIELDVNPFHAPPKWMYIHCCGKHHSLRMSDERSMLIVFSSLVRRYDPDLLLTAWGDTWLMPFLLELSEQHKLSLPLNRDEQRKIEHRPERTYFSYGRVIYRGQQMLFSGRGHIDVTNAVLFGDYGLDGVLEMSRVTRMPLQASARLSPGTGISSMQIYTALEQGVLVPWHKQQVESPKTAMDLIHADRGGLVFQPEVGLHHDAAEIDFISMYPSVMEHFNISPETVGESVPGAVQVPELNLYIEQDKRGLVPKTLAPLLGKRIDLKSRLAEMPRLDARRRSFEAQASAHKWLLVTCFGYLGYKNARFGRIEAHEAVTAYGREALLRAKEAAEDMGFTVLHMYVDGFWVKKEGASTVQDFKPLLNEVLERTGLPVALEGIYRWIAFLPSRMDARVPVANRYYGAFRDGTVKVRGIEARRRDTPPFIEQMQRDMLDRMVAHTDNGSLDTFLPDLLQFVRGKLEDLRTGRIPMEDLLVSQKLSKELEDYTVPSPAARAAVQLQEVGKQIKRGQKVRFHYTLNETGVYAWDMPDAIEHEALDMKRYSELFLRAASTIMGPLGVDEETLRRWLFQNAGYAAPPGILAGNNGLDLPLWQYGVTRKQLLLANEEMTPPLK